MTAFIAMFQRYLPALLLGLVFLFVTKPADAWNSSTDSLRICNTDQNNDVNVALASKAVPGGIAALMRAGWRREGWWRVKAGRCELTMRLRDVQNYEIWLYVQVVGGSEITWPTPKEQFCVHPTKAFEAFAWSKGEIQKCAKGERLETFWHMSSLYNEADNYSIYSVANRTIELKFDYGKSAARPKSSTAAPSVPPKIASIHPDTGKLVQTKKYLADLSFEMKLYASFFPANDAAIIRQYIAKITSPSKYELLRCTYNQEIVNGEFRTTGEDYWYNSVDPDYLNLVRRLTKRDFFAKVYGILAVNSCPATLDAANEFEERNIVAASKLK